MKTLHLLMQVLSWIIKDQYLTVRQFFQQGPKHQRWRTNIVTNLTNYKRSLCVKIQSFGITSLRLKMRNIYKCKEHMRDDKNWIHNHCRCHFNLSLIKFPVAWYVSFTQVVHRIRCHAHIDEKCKISCQ